MLYLPLIVFIGVTVWIAGWRKAVEITGVSLLICLMFGVGFGVLLPLSVAPRIFLVVGAVLVVPAWMKRGKGAIHRE